jgi:hypothetical protein
MYLFYFLFLFIAIPCNTTTAYPVRVMDTSSLGVTTTFDTTTFDTTTFDTTTKFSTTLSATTLSSTLAKDIPIVVLHGIASSA